jgi:type IV secretion system protein VirB9
MSLLFLLLAQVAAPPTALPPQSWAPPPMPPSPYVQLVDYQADHAVSIQGSAGYQIALELAPDERVETVSLGDSGAWQVSASKRGDRLFLKPIQTGAITNMIVVTDTRSYLFELSSGGDGYQTQSPYIVRFRYPSEQAALPMRAAGDGLPFQATEYKLRGDKSLRPSSIYDDGVHTYISWPDDVPLPAVYAIGDGGKEMLVNAAMRGSELVVDSVQHKLVFRVDRRSASASRKRAQQ